MGDSRISEATGVMMRRWPFMIGPVRDGGMSAAKDNDAADSKRAMVLKSMGKGRLGQTMHGRAVSSSLSEQVLVILLAVWARICNSPPLFHVSGIHSSAATPV